MMADDMEITDDCSSFCNEMESTKKQTKKIRKFGRFFRSFGSSVKKDVRKLSLKNKDLEEELQQTKFELECNKTELKTKDDYILELKDIIKSLKKQKSEIESENWGMVERVIEVINKHSENGCEVNLQIGQENRIERHELNAGTEKIILQLDDRMATLVSERSSLTEHIANLQLDLKAAKTTLHSIMDEVQKLCEADNENRNILIRMQENIGSLLHSDVSNLTLDGLHCIAQDIVDYEIDDFEFSVAGQAGQKWIRYIATRYDTKLYWLRMKWEVPIDVLEDIALSDETLQVQVCCKLLFWVLKIKGWKQTDVIASLDELDAWVLEVEKSSIKENVSYKGPAISGSTPQSSMDVSTDFKIFRVENEATLNSISSKLDEAKKRDQEHLLEITTMFSKVLNAVAEDGSIMRDVTTRRSAADW
ncbi:hypothetical protein ScPMuIL_000171 [Solemya velum]